MACKTIGNILKEVDGNGQYSKGLKVFVVVMITKNGCKRYHYKRRWWGERTSCACVVGRSWRKVEDGKVTYIGGSRKCILVKERMRVEAV